MAFEARAVRTDPELGVIKYQIVVATDTVAQIKANGYWSAAISETADPENYHGRRALESFVESQRTKSDNGVPILIRGSDGLEWDEAYIHSDGRIRMRGGNWNIT